MFLDVLFALILFILPKPLSPPYQLPPPLLPSPSFLLTGQFCARLYWFPVTVVFQVYELIEGRYESVVRQGCSMVEVRMRCGAQRRD